MAARNDGIGVPVASAAYFLGSESIIMLGSSLCNRLFNGANRSTPARCFNRARPVESFSPPFFSQKNACPQGGPTLRHRPDFSLRRHSGGKTSFYYIRSRNESKKNVRTAHIPSEKRKTHFAGTMS
jgi:hypothetical protein